MFWRTRCLYFFPILLAVASCAASQTGLATPEARVSAGPEGPWLQYADVRQAGYDARALQAICERADSLRSGALMAVFRGHVILACGDVRRSFETHSVRKSLVSGLYGTAVAAGEI